MDEKFWANLDATRRAMERATAGIDIKNLTLASEAARFATTIDFANLSSTLAVGNYSSRSYERFSANSALVGETLASAMARSTIALPELTSASTSETVRLAATRIHDFDSSKVMLAGVHALKIARINDAVTGALSSTAFDNLAALERSLSRRLVSLSDSYRDIFTGLTKIDFALPAYVTELPPRDMVVKSTIVSSRAIAFDPKNATIDLDDPAYARSDVDFMLAELDADLVTMLDEAMEVVFSTSTGRVRHASISPSGTHHSRAEPPRSGR
jgi:hypothetical protein